jgi:hypothetical protein
MHFCWLSIELITINRNKIEESKLQFFLLFWGIYKFIVSYGPFSKIYIPPLPLAMGDPQQPNYCSEDTMGYALTSPT